MYPLATVWPDGNFHTVNAKRFADEVKTSTSGAVEIDVKSGGQLGFKGPEQLRAVRERVHLLRREHAHACEQRRRHRGAPSAPATVSAAIRASS